MEMVLTGDQLSAEEALMFGLVSRVYSKETSFEESVKLAQKIAKMPRLICIL